MSVLGWLPVSHDPYSPPASSVADPDAAATLARPIQTTLGVHVLWVVLTLNLLGTVISVLRQGEALGHAEIAAAAVTISLVMVAVVFGLLFWFLWAAGKGKNWARITLTALIAIGVLLVAYKLAFNFRAAPVESTFATVAVLAQVIALVLLYRPESNAWYRAVRDAG
jgi:uncharacterized membrane protein